jgi:hypothetical protein
MLRLSRNLVQLEKGNQSITVGEDGDSGFLGIIIYILNV